MAIRVGVSGVTTKSVTVVGSTTQVKKVVVGTPVRRIRSTALDNLGDIGDVNISNLTNGSVLVYNSGNSEWTAQLDLNEQNVDGGSY